LGIVFVPDKRARYKSPDCKDQETDYARWIVEAWERLLANHFRSLENPQNASVSGFFRFDNLPAMMRVRVTTPNVLEALRKRDPERRNLTILRTPQSFWKKFLTAHLLRLRANAQKNGSLVITRKFTQVM
jgi:hypothetical protein